MDVMARFWSHVNHDDWDGCWPWLAAKNEKGYGVFGVTSKDTRLAHRFSYEIYRGPVASSDCVLHRCDNPSCVRPSHLFLGTRGDNNSDSVAKGRNSRGDKHSLVTRGERNGRAKLTSEQVLEIRQSYTGRRGGVTLSCLAQRYAMSIPQVHSIVRGLSWSHVA